MSLNSRTVLAFIVGGVLTTGAFFLKPDPAQLPFTQLATASSAIRNFIPVKDSDNNGIPDWQEPFAVGTIDLDENTTVSTTTLTGQLAASLGDYLSSGESDPDLVLSLIGTELMTSSVDHQYTTEDIQISSNNDQDALRDYGNAVAIIANSYPLPVEIKNEVDILNDSFSRGDEEVLESLDLIIASYEGMRDDMLELAVPSSLTREHLSLINVYNALLIDINAFRNVYEDALMTTLRLRRYPADRTALKAAISNLYLKLHQSGIQWGSEDAASKFVEVRL